MGWAAVQAGLRLRLARLHGWRMSAVMLALGGLMALTMAPFFFFWLLPICLGPAFIAWQEAKTRWQAFARLWWFSFGYFVAGLYWIGIAVTSDWQTFWWFLPVPVILLPAFLAAMQAGGALIATLRPFWRHAWGGPLAFAASWLLIEWVKLWIFTGFPWNLLGYSFAFTPWLMQPASLGGVWLLSTLALLFALGPWMGGPWMGAPWMGEPGAAPGKMQGTMRETAKRTDAQRLDPAVIPATFRPAWTWLKTMRLLGPALGLAALAFNLVYSAAVLWTTDDMETLLAGQDRVALIQPNLEQGILQSPEQQRKVIERLLLLSRAAIGESERLNAAGDGAQLAAIIWPEAAVPEVLHRRPALQGYLTRDLPAETLLITGSIRLEADAKGAPLYYNSFDVLDHMGREQAYYNKRYLVPFGEYVPFKSVLDLLPSITGGFINTSKGLDDNPIKVKGLGRFLPSICYEGIVPNFHREGLKQGGKLILNLTNDGWFGLSTGPYQHFAIQRLRSVEANRPLIRVSNPGISAIFDGVGRQVAAIDLGLQSYHVSRVPRAASKMTIFSQIGNLWALMLAALLFLGARLSITDRKSSHG